MVLGMPTTAMREAPALRFPRAICVGAALGAVAADAEEDVDLVVDRGNRRSRPGPGGRARCRGWCRRRWWMCSTSSQVSSTGGRRRARVQALVAVADAEDLPDAVVVVELEEGRADDVVEAGAQAAAGDDGGRWSGPGRRRCARAGRPSRTRVLRGSHRRPSSATGRGSESRRRTRAACGCGEGKPGGRGPGA